jgi:hypothetical protein
MVVNQRFSNEKMMVMDQMFLNGKMMENGGIHWK